MGTFIKKRATDGLTGMAEVCFPENDFGAPDWRSTSIVTRTFEYMAELPPRSRAMLMLLFAGVEIAAPLLLICFSRFSRLSKERRLRAIEGWANSRYLAFTLIGDSIKAVLVMMYMSHSSVSEYMGEYKSCSQPEDPLQLPIRPNTLNRSHDGADSHGPPDPRGVSETSEVPEAV